MIWYQLIGTNDLALGLFGRGAYRSPAWDTPWTVAWLPGTVDSRFAPDHTAHSADDDETFTG
jgi:hypothetical protein